MREKGPFGRLRFATAAACLLVTGSLVGSCGGGAAGTSRDAGPSKTTLTVDASDADGDALQYQWRVNGGTVLNANARTTTWTLPDGPGLHFAYVTVSDGKGGYAQQQYAVSSDSLGIAAPVPAPRTYTAASVADFDGATVRLRFQNGPGDHLMFTPAGGGAPGERDVYMPDVLAQLYDPAGNLVFSGTTDVSGELDPPKLATGSYVVQCATSRTAPMTTSPNSCGTVFVGGAATVATIYPPIGADRNLRLHGHVADLDGAVCGTHDEFFGIDSAATVQLQQADGTALGAAVRVNRFGDYSIDAPVPVNASLRLAVSCEGLQTTAAVPAPATAAGYTNDQRVELSVTLANHRPTIVRMVANGLDGNVRGAMVLPETGVQSDSMPGALQFLSYKAVDTRLSGCMYYRALGAVADCDAQGTPSGAISFDDWKRAMHFSPYTQGNTEVGATYINKMDLNLVRRMVATRVDATHIAFYVCNHPGPPVQDQANVDAVLGVAFANQKQVACVAMESTPSGGVNGGAPFTKFFVFAPDGSLLTSVNLDGRGEKYVPGSCVACHGGSVHDGRFPEQGTPSPYLGANFLAFDTGNYLFGSDSSLTEAAQGESLYQLNQLVLATQPSPTNATSTLIQGWYASGAHVLDKTYVPPAWQQAASQPQASTFYREVIATSCRTCHASLASPTYDWNANAAFIISGSAYKHFCGGTPDLASNASMPNALIARDRLMQRAQADTQLQGLLQSFLGCSAPLPDPVFPRR
jgi:hypothetical protein